MAGIDAPSSGVLGGAEIFGRNGNLLTGDARNDITGSRDADSLYPGFPVSTTPVELFAVGTANDTVAGTGAQTLRALVLRTVASKSYEAVDVDMNGATGVSLGECYRCIYAEVTRFGSSGANGLITIENSGGTVEYANMPAGDGQTEECVYTVPAGLPIDIRRIRAALSVPATGGSTSCRLSILIRELGAGGFVPARTFLMTNQRPLDINFVIPLVVQPLSDVKLQTTSLTTNNSQLNATLDFGP